MDRIKPDKNQEKDKDKKKKPVKPKRDRVSPAEYFRGVRTEMKKVVWPTRKELGAFTAVVMVACTFFALFFAGVDYVVFAALKAVLGIEFF